MVSRICLTICAKNGVQRTKLRSENSSRLVTVRNSLKRLVPGAGVEPAPSYEERILSPWREFSVNRCLDLAIQFLVTEKYPTKLFCTSGSGHPGRTPVRKTSRAVFKELAPQSGQSSQLFAVASSRNVIYTTLVDWTARVFELGHYTGFLIRSFAPTRAR